ncbi:MAG: hypothetical protein LRZ99_02695 [Desulfotomaculum sp.]|nr:hypothetical protein [Desulfotomaculum sp.]
MSRGSSKPADLAGLELRVSKIEHILEIEQQYPEQYRSQQANYDQWRNHEI